MARHAGSWARLSTWRPRRPYHKSSWIAAALAVSLVVGINAYFLFFFHNAPAPSAAIAPKPSPSRSPSPSPTPSPTKTTPKPSPSPKPTPKPAPVVYNAVPWKSGVSYPDVAEYATEASITTQFGTWRGRPTGIAVAYPMRDSWSDFADTNSFYTTWAAEPYQKSFALPLYPDDSGDTASDCIAGSYDSYWRTFADTMNSTGLTAQHTIIRLGWEMNLHTDWGTPAQFAACFRVIESTVSAIAPGLLWDWNVNRGDSAGMPDTEVLSAYPGNAYVNIVGIDSYDIYPPATVSSGWQTQLNGPYGLNYWLEFARSHGKEFSVPEWGVSSGAWPGNDGGDDAGYIRDMYDFFVSCGGTLEYESYYDDGGPTSIYDPDTNPKSSAEYVRLWR